MGLPGVAALESSRRPVGLLILEEDSPADVGAFGSAPRVYLLLQSPASLPDPPELSLEVPAIRTLLRSVAGPAARSSVRLVSFGAPASRPPAVPPPSPAPVAWSLVPLRESEPAVSAEIAHRRETVLRLGTALAEPRTLQEIAVHILQIVEETLPFDYADVWIHDRSRGRLAPWARIDLERRKWCYRGDSYGPLEERVARGEGILGWVAATGRSCCVGDVREDPRYVSLDPKVRSELCVPMIAGGRVAGLINLESRKPAAYGPAEEDMLRILARQAAVAVDNARLQEEKREADARTEESLRALTEKNRELEVLLDSFSHDLKNPLIALKGFVSLLQAAAPAGLDEKSRVYLQRVATNADRIEALTGSLLELSRAGQADEPSEAVDSATVAAEVVRELSLRIEAAGAVVRVEPGMPVVWASRRVLYQLLSNLAGNALRFLDPARPGRISIGASSRRREIRFHVRDNGTGIAPADHARIFQPFTRLPGAPGDGHGMGLAICRRLTEGLGGRIWVDSAPGRGSTFYFTVPRPAASVRPAGEESPGARPGDGKDRT